MPQRVLHTEVDTVGLQLPGVLSWLQQDLNLSGLRAGCRKAEHQAAIKRRAARDTLLRREGWIELHQHVVDGVPPEVDRQREVTEPAWVVHDTVSRDLAGLGLQVRVAAQLGGNLPVRLPELAIGYHTLAELAETWIAGQCRWREAVARVDEGRVVDDRGLREVLHRGRTVHL